MWQHQEQISSMKKPCRNNSPSYENWLVVRTKRATLSAGEFKEYESLLEDLQRKERECPVLEVLKMIHRGRLNKGVSSTAKFSHFQPLGRTVGKRQTIFPDPSVHLSVTAHLAAVEVASMFAYTVPRHQNDTSSKPSPSRNTEVIIFTFGSRIAFILKKFRISVLKPHPSKTVYFRSLKSSFSFPLQFLINYLHIPFFLPLMNLTKNQCPLGVPSSVRMWIPPSLREGQGMRLRNRATCCMG